MPPFTFVMQWIWTLDSEKPVRQIGKIADLGSGTARKARRRGWCRVNPSRLFIVFLDPLSVVRDNLRPSKRPQLGAISDGIIEICARSSVG